MPTVEIPRLSWKTPLAELNADPALWRKADLSEEAIVEFERKYPGKVRGLDPKITTAAKAAASAKRALEAKAALAEAERQAKVDAEAAAKAAADGEVA